MILVPPITHPLREYHCILFDADGTLRETVVDGQRQARPPNEPGEWQLLPGVREVMACYDWSKVYASICSNQGGIALGYMSEIVARFLLKETLSEATGSVIGPAQIWCCPHAPKSGCPCRKPEPLLLLRAIHAWQEACTEESRLLYGLAEVLYVGDQETDAQAAENAGIDFIYAADFFNRGTRMSESIDVRLSDILDDLARLVRHVEPPEIQVAVAHIVNRLDALVEETLGLETPRRGADPCEP